MLTLNDNIHLRVTLDRLFPVMSHGFFIKSYNRNEQQETDTDTFNFTDCDDWHENTLTHILKQNPPAVF